MGLPDVVDFARNLAVMVRVQGPDPKGLKMRNHAFHHYNSGKTMLSASGMIFPASNDGGATEGRGNLKSSDTVLVLTAASVIEPFVLQQYRENTSEDKPPLVPGVQIDILMEGKSMMDGNMEALPWVPAELLKMVNIPQSSAAVQSLIEASCGSLENSWEVGWSLASHSRGPQHVIENSYAQLAHGLFGSTRVPISSSEDGTDMFQFSVVDTCSKTCSMSSDVNVKFTCQGVGISLSSLPCYHSVHQSEFYCLSSVKIKCIKYDSFQVQQSPFPNNRSMLRMESSNPNLMGQSATRIALLAIPSKFHQNFPKLQTSIPRRGDLLLAMGSPFGILSPLHFFNNISVGSIGNSYPPSSFMRAILMADIRCLPGMEGSPVFNEHAQFVGLLTRPLRQKVSGTEVQMVIPWEAIASACSDLLQEELHTGYNSGNLNTVENMLSKGYSNELSDQSHQPIHSDSQPPPIENAMNSICLITTDDGSWASGVLLNKQGLVLTNAHLVEPWRFGKTATNGDRNDAKLDVTMIPNTHTRLDINGEKSGQNLLMKSQETADICLTRCSSANIIHRNIRVRLDFMDPWMWTDARIVYISRGPMDIALLQLEIVPDQLCPIVMDINCPSPGAKAYVIGHGLFGPRCDFLPSACLGVIAKVIEATKTKSSEGNLSEQFPAMLETTAAVHPGSSGGAVVNSNGHMIGLVTSNAKHGGGTVIPHLNFSIPCAALEPILKFSKDMRDVTILEELEKPNEHLSSVWALMPPLYPKTDPLLDIPKFPAEDNIKGVKGSHFAKFIADRNELLKTTNERGTARSFLTNDLMPSKL